MNLITVLSAVTLELAFKLISAYKFGNTNSFISIMLFNKTDFMNAINKLKEKIITILFSSSYGLLLLEDEFQAFIEW